jgi:hypothetical protein
VEIVSGHPQNAHRLPRDDMSRRNKSIKKNGFGTVKDEYMHNRRVASRGIGVDNEDTDVGTSQNALRPPDALEAWQHWKSPEPLFEGTYLLCYESEPRSDGFAFPHA